MSALTHTPFEERLWLQTDKNGPIPEHKPELGPCWVWTGNRHKQGYGTIKKGKKQLLAHRAMYEECVGPIPDGMDLDHLCSNTPCVKAIGDGLGPSHLEPVTHRENVLRGNGVAAKNAMKAECKRGHPLSDENLGIDPRGNRFCRACRRWRYHNKKKKLQDEAHSAMIVDTYSGEE